MKANSSANRMNVLTPTHPSHDRSDDAVPLRAEDRVAVVQRGLAIARVPGGAPERLVAHHAVERCRPFGVIRTREVTPGPAHGRGVAWRRRDDRRYAHSPHEHELVFGLVHAESV